METQKYKTTTKSSLATKYEVSLPTFNKWLEKVPNLSLTENQRTLTPKQVEIIYMHLGEPPD